MQYVCMLIKTSSKYLVYEKILYQHNTSDFFLCNKFMIKKLKIKTMRKTLNFLKIKLWQMAHCFYIYSFFQKKNRICAVKRNLIFSF